MNPEVVIPLSVFLVIFGIFYLFLSTRNKERLALIEKGADASVFAKGRRNASPFWKVFTLNLAVLLMGIGVGVFVAALLTEIGVEEGVAYAGSIFLLSGAGLFVGFNLTKRLDQE